MKTFFILFIAILSSITVTSQIPDHVPSTGLRGWWSFSGNTLDASGNNINGTITGGTLVPDRHGRAASSYLFDGSNDWINLGDNNLLDMHTSDWTISAWIKTTSTEARIFSKGTHGGSQPGYDLMIYPSSGGRAAVILGTGHEHIIKSDNPVNDNKWHLITGVIDRHGLIKLYVDGIEQTATADISDHASDDIAAGTYNATIGVSYCYYGSPNSLNEFFFGQIDEVGVWGRALTSCEILDLYHEHSRNSSTTVTQCYSYTAPDDTVYTTSGIITSVIPSATGCDSIITTDLTITGSSTSHLTVKACESYVAPDDSEYTASGTITVVIPNAAGCDSIMTIDLKIAKKTSSSIQITACDSYIAPDGASYATSGIKTAVIPNSEGCDSTITIDLKILKSTTSHLTVNADDSYTGPDDSVYTATGIITVVIPNAAGCDSVITIDLTIAKSTASHITVTSCDRYTAPDGAVYTTSGIKTAVIPNAAGSDSTITIDLTIQTVTISVTQADNLLSANASPAFYRWLDCSNNSLPVTGENGQSFTAMADGDYAVEITQGGCVDTSACYTVDIADAIGNTVGRNILVYPNPTRGLVFIDLGTKIQEGEVTISDVHGNQVKNFQFFDHQIIKVRIDEPAGIYLMTITAGNKRTPFRIIKK
jgi:hypothetical protein